MKRTIRFKSIFFVLAIFIFTSKLIAQNDQQLVLIKNKAIDMGNKLFNFWETYGPDKEYGGFYGTINNKGESVNPTDKGIIQEARHLWAFSSWYQNIAQTDEVKLICDNLYSFIIKNFIDKSNNEFYWSVKKDGTLKNSDERLYSNAFAIYGLSQYSIAFNKPEAAEYAMKCFRSIDKRAHDVVNGGYDQSSESNWLSPQARKETNTQIHIMEAFTALFEATGNDTVKARLNEMIDVIANKVIQPKRYAHLEFKADWEIVGKERISYGHDIETTWLLVDAARAANRLSDKNIINKAVMLGSNAIAEGYDQVNGGIFDSGIHGGAVTSNTKNWWPQAETLLGLYCLYKYTDNKDCLDKIQETLGYIEKHHLTSIGEWTSIADDRDRYIGYAWKASYHSMRSMIYLNKWIEISD